MKKIIDQLKTHSPVIPRQSFERLKQDIASKNRDIVALHARGEDWAREVRALRLEVQRLIEFEKWLAVHFPTPDVIVTQRAKSAKFAYRPLISIILPVYNTNTEYLKTCIDSVLAQSYDKWQLCIVDDASTNQATIDCLKSYAKRDRRIVMKRSARNGHISVASNQAIEMAKGEFIGLLDHDDYLWPNALYEVVTFLQKHRDADFIYSDEDKIDIDEHGFIHFAPYFKPDWSPHLLECINLMTHFSVLKTALVREIGGFDKNMVGAQDWDLFLRLSDRASKIYHIPTILYSWRSHPGSTAMNINVKSYALINQQEALGNHFKRVYQHKVHLVPGPHGYWYPKHEVEDHPLISIVIPTKDKVDYLKRCINTILDKTSYSRYEIIIVDTGSTEAATKAYYKELKESLSPKKLSVTYWRHQPFNYSDACNFGAKRAKGDYLVMLNNDTEVITDTWLEDMLGYAQLPDVGAVGVKLLYPNLQIQHAGVAIGLGSIERPLAGHIAYEMNYESADPLQELYTNTVRDVTAVTAACLMVSTKKFWGVTGFDPALKVTFNDVDLCLKFRRAGFKNIYLPFVELFHHESVSIGRVAKKIEDVSRDMDEFDSSMDLIRKKWGKLIDKGDPYYNKNFYILSSNFGLDIYGNRDIKDLTVNR